MHPGTISGTSRPVPSPIVQTHLQNHLRRPVSHFALESTPCALSKPDRLRDRTIQSEFLSKDSETGSVVAPASRRRFCAESRQEKSPARRRRYVIPASRSSSKGIRPIDKDCGEKSGPFLARRVWRSICQSRRELAHVGKTLERFHGGDDGFCLRVGPLRKFGATSEFVGHLVIAHGV